MDEVNPKTYWPQMLGELPDLKRKVNITDGKREKLIPLPESIEYSDGNIIIESLKALQEASNAQNKTLLEILTILRRDRMV